MDGIDGLFQYRTGRSVRLNRHATTTCERYRVGREAASGLGQALGPPPPTRLPIANVHADRRISMRESNAAHAEEVDFDRVDRR